MKRLTPYLLPAVFGLLFVATSLFVLAYALGYQLDFKHRRIEKTGLAYLTSFPGNAFITVDNHYINKKTPHKTNPLLPGEHTLKVQKEGYTPWVEKATIKPELATLFEHILLFPIKPQRHLLQPKGAASQTFIPANGNTLVYTVGSGLDAGVWTAGLDLGSPRRILPLASIVTPSTTSVTLATFSQFVPYALSSDGSTMLVTATRPGVSVTLLVPLADPSTSAVLTDTYKDFSDFRFEAGQSRRLYALRAGTLYRIDAASTSAPTLIADDVIAYTSAPGTVSYVKNSASGIALYSAASDGTDPKLLLSKLTDTQYTLSDDPASGAVALLSVPDGQLRVISRNSAQQIQVLIVGNSYSYIKWSRSDSRLLYGGGSGAFVYDLPDVVTTQVFGAGLPPQNIDWLYDAYHLIYINSGKVLVSEVDGQNTTQLAASSVLPAYSNNSKDLYIADPTGALLAQSTRQTAD